MKDSGPYSNIAIERLLEGEVSDNLPDKVKVCEKEQENPPLSMCIC